jgi:hypothetical protein
MDGFESDIGNQATFGCTATVGGAGMGSGSKLQKDVLEPPTIPDEAAAWKRVDELGLKPYSPERPRDPRITFGEVAAHYVKFELPDDQSHATIDKSQSTITKYKHYLNSWVLPKWRKERALAVHPFEVEDWFKQIEREHRLETSTLAEVRKIMNLVYRHSQRYGILPRTDEGNPMLFVRLPGDPHSTNDSERESVA